MAPHSLSERLAPNALLLCKGGQTCPYVLGKSVCWSIPQQFVLRASSARPCVGVHNVVILAAYPSVLVFTHLSAT